MRALTREAGEEGELGDLACIFNIAQHPSHHKRPDDLAPRNLTGGFFWSEARAGPLVAKELFALQGSTMLQKLIGIVFTNPRKQHR